PRALGPLGVHHAGRTRPVLLWYESGQYARPTCLPPAVRMANSAHLASNCRFVTSRAGTGNLVLGRLATGRPAHLGALGLLGLLVGSAGPAPELPCTGPLVSRARST